MNTGNTRLDRPFRFDSKFPSGGFSTTPDTCIRCGDGTMTYDPQLGESCCRSCNAPLHSNGVSEP